MIPVGIRGPRVTTKQRNTARDAHFLDGNVDRSGPAHAMRWRYLAPLEVVTRVGATVYRDVLPGMKYARVWQGSIAATVAANILIMDHTASDWVIFTVATQGAGPCTVMAAKLTDFEAITTPNTCGIHLSWNQPRGWRRWISYAAGGATPPGCVPFVTTDGTYASLFSPAQAFQLKFGPNGSLYGLISNGGIGFKIIKFTFDGAYSVVFDTVLETDVYMRTSSPVGYDSGAGQPLILADFVVTSNKIYYSSVEGGTRVGGGTVRSRNLDGTSPTIVAGMTTDAIRIYYNGNGTAITCRLDQPGALALAPDSLSLLIGDTGNGMVRRLTFSTGLLTTVLGGLTIGGTPHPFVGQPVVDGFIVAGSGDGGLATANGNSAYTGDEPACYIVSPTCVYQAANGDIYASSGDMTEIRKVDHSTGIVSTIKGGGTQLEWSTGGDRGHHSRIGYGCPSPGNVGDFTGFCFDLSRNLFSHHCGQLWRNGTAITNVTTPPSTLPGLASGYDLEYPTAPDQFSSYNIRAMVVDSDGTLFVGCLDGVVRIGCPLTTGCFCDTPVIQFLAGSDTASGYVDGLAPIALFNTPGAIDVGPTGVVYIVDGGNNAIRRYYPATQTVDTLLIDANIVGVTNHFNTGWTIGGITVAANGDLYYMTSRTGYGQVKKVPFGGSTGTIIAGEYAGGTTTLPATALSVLLDGYGGCRLSPDNRTLYLPQPSLSQVWAMDLASGLISHYAGNGKVPDVGSAFQGDSENLSDYTDAGLLASKLTAMFPRPMDIAFDPRGNPVVFSSLFGSASRINSDGSVTRLTGTGAQNTQYNHFFNPSNVYSGDSLAASGVDVGWGGQGTTDICGNLLVASAGFDVIRFITPDGILHTVAGAARDNPAGSDYPTPFLTHDLTVDANSVRLGGIPTGVAPRAGAGGGYAVLAGSGTSGHNSHGLILISCNPVVTAILITSSLTGAWPIKASTTITALVVSPGDEAVSGLGSYNTAFTALSYADGTWSVSGYGTAIYPWVGAAQAQLQNSEGMMPIPGTDLVWYKRPPLGVFPYLGHGLTHNPGCAFRQIFTLPPVAVVSAYLQIIVQGKVKVWINGTALDPITTQWLATSVTRAIPSGVTPWIAGQIPPFITVVIPPSLFISGASNILAIYAEGVVDAYYGGARSVDFGHDDGGASWILTVNPPEFHGDMVIPSSTEALVLSGLNSDPLPTGWETRGFDDSGWGHAIVPGCAPGSLNAGSQIWSEEPGTNIYEQVLIRQHFTLPFGTIDAGTVVADGFYIAGIFVNGHDVGETGGIPQISVPLAAGWLIPGGDNVIALQVQGTSDRTSLCKYVSYELDVTFS